VHFKMVGKIKNDAVLLIRVKQDEQLFSKLEEAVIINMCMSDFHLQEAVEGDTCTSLSTKT